ncbi:hypothetical protein SPONL_1790 [uncultured Candidatus Thioglobus sp.]|nr:hypothetical protein SPONL_1790 [uncultured Candidatus Thioglobus sp.]
MTTIGIRELARSSAILEGHDYAQIEDKKTKQEVDEIMQFAGSVNINPKYDNMTSSELRRARALKL